MRPGSSPPLAKAAETFFASEPTPEHEIERGGYRRLRVDRCAHPSYRFDVVCPPSFRCVTASRSAPTYDEPVCDLLHMTGADGKLVIDVAGVMLRTEVDAGDWLRLCLHGAQERIDGWREKVGPEGRRVDCLTTHPTSKRLTRWMVRKFGERMFVVRAQSVDTVDERVAKDVSLLFASIAPLEKKLLPLVEPTRTFQIQQPAPMMIVYPESWLLVQPTPLRATHATVNIVNMRAGEGMGMTTVAAMRVDLASSPEQLRDLYLEQLADLPSVSPFALRAAPDGILPLPGASVPRCEAFVGSSTDQNDAVEVRVAVIRHPECWILIGTYGPTMWNCAAAWLENKRAHEIAVGHLWLPEEVRAVDDVAKEVAGGERGGQ